jgi:alpha-tubulin suppressor-like RCC1 family protein
VTACNNHTLAVAGDGRVYVWGVECSDGTGALGLGLGSPRQQREDAAAHTGAAGGVRAVTIVHTSQSQLCSCVVGCVGCERLQLWRGRVL